MPWHLSALCQATQAQYTHSSVGVGELVNLREEIPYNLLPHQCPVRYPQIWRVKFQRYANQLILLYATE